MSKKSRNERSITREWSTRPPSTKETARWHREQKLTAALYAGLPGVLEHVRKTGKLPSRDVGGAWLGIGLNVLIGKRGADIALTDDEQLVFDAMGRESPYGRAILIADDAQPKQKRRA